MALSPAQLVTLKAAILAETDPTFVDYRDTGATGAMADWYNELTAGPEWKVWRTNVSRAEIYNDTSVENTNWSWTFYKNQSAVEQNSWVQMFMGDQANFSRPNLRAGIAVIFTAASSANATHARAIGKRTARVAEKLFSSGTGSIASPATMTFEGKVTNDDVVQAINLP